MNDVPPGMKILDFGPESVADLNRRLASIRTVLWNGPLGAFETAPFGEATFAVAREVARLTKEDKLISVAGGGDTVRALERGACGRRLQLCLDRGRGLPGMARRGAIAGRGRPLPGAAPARPRDPSWPGLSRPSTLFHIHRKTWMPGIKPGMTILVKPIVV